MAFGAVVSGLDGSGAGAELDDIGAVGDAGPGDASGVLAAVGFSAAHPVKIISSSNGSGDRIPDNNAGPG